MSSLKAGKQNMANRKMWRARLTNMQNFVFYKMDLQQIRHLFMLHDSRVAKDIVRRVERSKDKVNGSCPTVICEYNQYMGGVDLSDHMKFSCQIGRRRTFRFTREPFSIFWILV